MFCLCQKDIFHGRYGDFYSVYFMGGRLVIFMSPVNNVTTSFSDVTFTGLVLNSSRITFTAESVVSWCMSPVNPITNSSILNPQIIATNYCCKF